MFFVIKDNKKKLKKYKILKTEIQYHLSKKSLKKQATYRLIKLNLHYIIDTKQHSDCVLPLGLWERTSFN